MNYSLLSEVKIRMTPSQSVWAYFIHLKYIDQDFVINNIERFANIDRNSSSYVTIVDICCPVVYKSDQGSLAAMSDTKSILTGIRVSIYIYIFTK